MLCKTRGCPGLLRGTRYTRTLEPNVPRDHALPRMNGKKASMKFVEREFVPVLLGGDINVYSVARAFYEQYQVKSIAVGKYGTGPAFQSRIVDYRAGEAIDTYDTCVRTVNSLARDHANKTVVLMGCGDSYVALIARAKDAGDLAENIVAPYGPFDLMDSAQRKEVFYELCAKHGVPYPHTFTFTQDMLTPAGEPLAVLDRIDFPFPMILKPSDGIMYWAHPFATQQKAYTIASRAELEQVIRDIYGAGYTDDLIIQDRVPGNDERMRVLTSYSDHTGTVRMMCLGHVLLEEHAPHAQGNHAVIITEPNDELCANVRKLLEDLHFVGFSNFDVKYDERDGSFKFFDFNTRQGRSNFYVTGSGFNVAKYVVEEYVYHKPFEPVFETAQDEHLWTVVPYRTIDEFVKDPELRQKAHRLIREGKTVNPVFMKGDNHPLRWLRMVRQHYRCLHQMREYYHD